MIEHDFDNMPLSEMYQKISEVKEMLAYLHGTQPDFPSAAYMVGSDCLRQAMTYIDDTLLFAQGLHDIVYGDE